MTDPDAAGLVARPAPPIAGSVGIFGGTFDPIHHGHLAIAEEAREAIGLEQVRFVPAAISPFKADRPVASAEQRLAMVEAAIAGNPAFTCRRDELDRPPPSYTVDTLEAVAAEGIGPDELWVILSTEALAGLPRWRSPERVLELARLAVVPRAGFDPLGPAWVREQLPYGVDRIRFLAGPLLPISGSVVRRRASVGRSVRYLLPEAVADYIRAERVYTEPASRTIPT